MKHVTTCRLHARTHARTQRHRDTDQRMRRLHLILLTPCPCLINYTPGRLLIPHRLRRGLCASKTGEEGGAGGSNQRVRGLPAQGGSTSGLTERNGETAHD